MDDLIGMLIAAAGIVVASAIGLLGLRLQRGESKRKIEREERPYLEHPVHMGETADAYMTRLEKEKRL